MTFGAGQWRNWAGFGIDKVGLLGSERWHFAGLVLWVKGLVTYYCAVQTFLGAKRMECVQLAGAFAKGRRSESASKLDALHTLRDIPIPSPLKVIVFTTALT